MSVGIAPDLGGNVTASPVCTNCGNNMTQAYTNYGGVPFQRTYNLAAIPIAMPATSCSTPSPIGNPQPINPNPVNPGGGGGTGTGGCNATHPLLGVKF